MKKLRKLVPAEPLVPAVESTPVDTLPEAASTGPNIVVTPEFVAKVAHSVNRAYCLANGDLSPLPWEAASAAQRESVIAGVAFLVANPDAGPVEVHNAWLKHKEAEGWVYGARKNEEAKTHPCIRAFYELSEFHQMKDHLFCAVVRSMTTGV